MLKIDKGSGEVVMDKSIYQADMQDIADQSLFIQYRKINNRGEMITK